jgi:N-acyl-D-amino-acid deacylase
METVAASQPSEHIATYVAHAALRIAVMGFANRPAILAELQLMKQILEEGLKAGAIGLSIGLYTRRAATQRRGNCVALFGTAQV